MLENIEVKPAEGRRVRDPRTGHPIPKDKWTTIPLTFFVLRRLGDGDLVQRGAQGTDNGGGE
jgi:hypothetical protein